MGRTPTCSTCGVRFSLEDGERRRQHCDADCREIVKLVRRVAKLIRRKLATVTSNKRDSMVFRFRLLVNVLRDALAKDD